MYQDVSHVDEAGLKDVAVFANLLWFTQWIWQVWKQAIIPDILMV
jgi:hypothetical protein